MEDGFAVRSRAGAMLRPAPGALTDDDPEAGWERDQHGPVGRAQVLAAQAGDSVAFAALYRDLQPRLLRYATLLVGQDAEDVTAEPWLQICRDLVRFHGDLDGFRGWCVTIVRHRALDHVRARDRRPVTPMSDTTVLDRPGPGGHRRRRAGRALHRRSGVPGREPAPRPGPGRGAAGDRGVGRRHGGPGARQAARGGPGGCAPGPADPFASFAGGQRGGRNPHP